MANGEHIGLPENARRELKEGEKYISIVPSSESMKEISFRSILLGFLMIVVFAGSTTYLALKTGNGIEAAIPISILAVGIGYLFKRKSTILENVNIMAIGSTAGLVAGAMSFVFPALFVLGLDKHVNVFQLFFSPMLGAMFGVMLLIPLRRYFVSDMHGKFPFPEGTAITEILIAGKKGGKDAIVLLYAMTIGAMFDLFAVTLRVWKETFTTDLIPSFGTLTVKYKAVFSTNMSAALVSLGYIVGIRFASMIAAGGLLATLVLIPLIAHFGIIGGMEGFADMTADDFYGKYTRMIGIGGIFMAGVITIIKFIPIIYKSTVQGLGEAFLSRKRHATETVERIERDIPMWLVLTLTFLVLGAFWFYFRYAVLTGQSNPIVLAFLGLASVFVFAFLFASVSSYAIATLGVTPISGMTLLTLLITALVFTKFGLIGEAGMIATLLVGGTVCVALSMTGTLITEMKIAYWVGATPKRIEWANIMGSVVAAAITAAVIMLLAKVYGFSPSAEHPNPLPAPQANAMAAVISSVMSGEAPWFLYASGAGIAVIMELIGISPLAFTLGIYLPLEINFPILVGATVSWLVVKSAGKNEALAGKYNERGTLVSSGLIAGGALMGVIAALIKWIETEKGIQILPDFANTGYWGNWLGLGMGFLLCLYMFVDARRVEK